ncbi:FAD-dependent oxidoreductase (plasmid) [Escherichia coli]
MKIVIVGGVAGGASAAARARRLSEDVSIVVFERGSDVSFANCGLPYHIGGKIPLRQSLILKTPEDFKSRFNIDVRIRHEVMSVDPVNKMVTVKNLTSGEVYTEEWDRLLLSTGAAPVVPPCPDYRKRVSLHCEILLTWMLSRRGLSNIISLTPRLSGGFIGLEVMEALSERGISVTLLEMGEQVMAPVDPEMASALHQEIRSHGVDLRLRTALTEVLRTETGFRVALSDGGFLQTDMVILAIGVKPESSLATGAGLAVGKRGGISVNACMQTSIPDIYAVGDAVETPDLVFQEPANVPLAGPANRQGRIAADNMLDRHSLYHGSQGTSICKVFSLSIGSVGANEKQLKAHGTRYEKVYVHAADHASYYPGATMISLKLLFSPDTGKILGAQASGKKGVDKRIDVLAVVQRAGLTVNDLEHLELTYAPPFNSARDVVNQAGMVAANVIKGDTVICHVRDVLQREPGSYCLLDIRSPAELKQFGEYPDALSIPLDSLRENLDKLPEDKEIIIGCQSGLRGHVAYRMLQSHGFRTYNLSGGFITWQAVTESMSQ